MMEMPDAIDYVMTYVMICVRSEEMDVLKGPPVFGGMAIGIPRVYSLDGRVYPSPQEGIEVRARVRRTDGTGLWSINEECFPLRNGLYLGDAIIGVFARQGQEFMTDGRTYSFPSVTQMATLEPIEFAPTDLQYLQEARFYEQQLTQLAAYPAQTYPAQQALGMGQLGQQQALGVDQLGQPLFCFGRGEADIKARELLLSLLTPEQREEYTTTGHFYVTRDGKQYKLGNNLQVRVRDWKKNTIENWCAFAANAPAADTIVSQLLMIRDDPRKLRAMANVTDMTGYDQRWQDRTRDAGIRIIDDPLNQPRGLRDRWANVARILQRAGYI